MNNLTEVSVVNAWQRVTSMAGMKGLKILLDLDTSTFSVVKDTSLSKPLIANIPALYIVKIFIEGYTAGFDVGQTWSDEGE